MRKAVGRSEDGQCHAERWFWQLGLVTSVWELDFTVANTDTNIDYVGCGNTPYCSGRVFLSLTNVF